ncbi:TPM domain-containing protein [Advenella mimigardefordensis]|uniref:Putative membrane protein n=1 Tax=Advenella mimigardefordensis (strain DSM 17166 / LMG 22922 / DPN7) TaxID=1247726 RepID=W0PG00_ADVMD|nr:TPM domain-containing protein [Advenella mimigardefordensis]AHG65621.1 putative membrane protein [Advenella mimigardefordensis DPN7]
MKKNFIAPFSFLFALFFCVNALAQYTVESIPNPKAQGHNYYLSDPDSYVSGNTAAELNQISTSIEQNNGSEFAIVVVNDYEGPSDFSFAMDLFSHWKIGKQGSDNGLLLFLAMDRHEYRFISGYGIEGVFPDALLKEIGETYLVPYLKSGNTDMALLATAKAVQSVFLSPAHQLELAGLQAYRPTFWNKHAAAFEQSLGVIILFAIGYGWIRWARERARKKFMTSKKKYDGHVFWYAFFSYLFLLFLTFFVFVFLEIVDQVYRFNNLPYFVAAFGALYLFFHYHQAIQFLKKGSKDKQTALQMQIAFVRMSLLPLLLSPFAYKAYFNLARNQKDMRARATPPDSKRPWTRLNRDSLKSADLEQYLGKLHLREEKIDARSYEIWRDDATGATSLVEFAGSESDHYSRCPSCHGNTLKKPAVKVLKRPTYSKTGTGENIQECDFCDYKKSLGMVTLPVLQRSSESGSSSGSGGSSSSSSGSSFGGGSSGGGGAGGRW